MTTQALGFSHFILQADPVGKLLLVVLLVMSIASWYLIVVKTLRNRLQRNRSRAFLHFFWNAKNLDEVRDKVCARPADEPFSHLAREAITAREHHARYGASRLEEAGSASDFLTRTMRKVIDEETAKMESGLMVLASVGSTAPFVGLFGTVWGVYHALINIGMTGSGSLDAVAGPVGEALIMTGVGLAVAIPAVLGYNFLVRANRVVLSQLDAFAHDLFAFLTTGQQVAASSGTVISLKSGS